MCRSSQYCRLPIFKIRVLTKAIYVVTDVKLIRKLQTHPKILFDPLYVLAAERLGGTSEERARDMRREQDADRTKLKSTIGRTHMRLNHFLKPGPSLDALLNGVIRNTVKELKPVGSTKLFEWTQYIVTIVGSETIYGPRNPFRDNPLLEQAFWDYEASIPLLMLNAFPTFLASKGVRARNLLRQAFSEYFSEGGASSASDLIRANHAANREHGVSNNDQGGFELITCIGLLVNTPPTLFWILYHIYSNPELLSEIRHELLAAAENGEVDLKQLPSRCALLYSVFQEVLRCHASSLSTRIVVEDVILDDGMLLKKGSAVHMPSSVLHSKQSYWNAPVNSFDPFRFMAKDGLQQDVCTDSTAFRPFGGGATLCPGRHFARGEILGMAVLIIARFDIVPLDGQWPLPKEYEGTMTTTVLPPRDDIDVSFIRNRDPGLGDLQLVVGA
ncbi:cytochrome P450 [Lophiostoma macrostomum CBS 122681]|uniref:Cytochrome P450 n=1 Tax=Lophiostoma macrostomum CBS 122681 TaxID=1314788 RepID=A0A6A6TSN4_9PLEO|nr:cytochrome P450 [Lophiostoma macrostomum CBS 122681]